MPSPDSISPPDRWATFYQERETVILRWMKEGRGELAGLPPAPFELGLVEYILPLYPIKPMPARPAGLLHSGEFFLLAALAAGVELLVLFGHLVRGRVFTAGRISVEEECFIALDQWNNGTRHAYEYLQNKKGPLIVLCLGAALGRRKGEELPVDLKNRVKFVRPWTGSASYLKAGPRYFKVLWKVWKKAANFGIQTGVLRKPFFHWLRHMIRGMGCLGWSPKTGLRPSCFVLAAQTVSESFLAAALQSGGHTTCHWLHGTLEHRLKFFGHCNFVIPQTPADAALLRERGDYDRVGEQEWKPALSRRDLNLAGPVVILTNLLHPAHHLPRADRIRSLRALLSILAGSQVPGLFWHPHPRERHDPEFPDLLREAVQLKIGVSDFPSASAAIQSASAAICSFSGVIGDCVRGGMVPLVWSDISYQRVGLWSQIPGELEFREESSFQSARDAMGRETGKFYETLTAAFGGGVLPPKPGWFKDLKERTK